MTTHQTPSPEEATMYEYDAYDEQGNLKGTGVVKATDDYDAQLQVIAIHGRGTFVVLREEQPR